MRVYEREGEWTYSAIERIVDDDYDQRVKSLDDAVHWNVQKPKRCNLLAHAIVNSYSSQRNPQQRSTRSETR
jgi:hypothetical protein